MFVFQVNYTQLGEICNLWRNYGDIQDSWDSVLNIIDWFFENQEVLAHAAGPGKWNDPDMVCSTDTIFSYLMFTLNYKHKSVKKCATGMLSDVIFLDCVILTSTADCGRLRPQHGPVPVSDGSVGHYGCSTFHVQ